MHRCRQRGRRESGLQGLAVPPQCGQLTRCFSVVAELLVFSGRLRKTIFFPQECWPFDQGHPVVDFDTNLK